MSGELKPCRYCGWPGSGSSWTIAGNGMTAIKCAKCGARGPHTAGRLSDAMALWDSRDEDAELAALRVEVERLIAAWPTFDDSVPYQEESSGAVFQSDGKWWVNWPERMAPCDGPFPTRETAVRAAAGLDAGDAKGGA
jgi:hypothetical protein